MPTTKRALKRYLLRAFLFFLAGGLVSTALLLCFPMKTRLDTILCLILGSTCPGGLYVAARYIEKRGNPVRTSRLFDVETYVMLIVCSPFLFVFAMGKGLWRLHQLSRKEA